MALADNSLKTASTAERAFATFCTEYNIMIGPQGMSDDDLKRYIAYLSTRVHSFETIKTYMSMGVRRFHEQHQLPWQSIKQRPLVKEVMQGARRALKETTGTNQKQPITVEILRQFRTHLNMADPQDLCVWTALLCAFYALLRKANVSAPTAAAAARSATKSTTVCGVLKRSDVQTDTYGTWLVLRDTKTIQYGQRTLRLPLPRIQNDPLCPTTAITTYMAITAQRPPNSQLFGATINGTWHDLTHAVFVKRIKQLIQLIGLDPKQYAGHSLRRGGATFAFARAGLHPLLIKALGDWVSAAFMRYCEVLEGLRLAGARAMATATLAAAHATAAAPHVR
jgi:hypothetical protein